MERVDSSGPARDVDDVHRPGPDNAAMAGQCISPSRRPSAAGFGDDPTPRWSLSPLRMLWRSLNERHGVAARSREPQRAWLGCSRLTAPAAPGTGLHDMPHTLSSRWCFEATSAAVKR